MLRSAAFALAGAALALLALLSAPLSAQQQPAPSAATLMGHIAAARAARLKGDHGNWLESGAKALALAPDHPDLLISVSRANAILGRKREALALLGQAVARGAGFDPARFPEHASLAADPEFRALSERAKANLAPVARAVPFALLPNKESEGIAWDPVSRRFFVGTSEGELLQIDSAGRVTPFASGGGLRQILGLKVDPARRRLWAATGRFPDLLAGPAAPPEDVGTTGIRAYDLDSGRRVAVYDLDERPLLHGFNDMALARDGTVYITDSAHSAIYVVDRGTGDLELLLADPKMSFPNGIVLSPDEKRLYVAHVEGISIVDPARRTRELLVAPANAAFNSIDGLVWYRDSLLGVQPSPYLHRVVRIRLKRGGRQVAGVSAVNARTPREYSQTTAALAGDALYMVGGSPSPDVYGGPPGQPRPQIWRIPLPR